MLPDFSEPALVARFGRRQMHSLHCLIDLSPWFCRAREVQTQRHQDRHMRRQLISHLHHLMTTGIRRLILQAVDMDHLQEARLIGHLRIGPIQATTRPEVPPDSIQTRELTSQDIYRCLVVRRRRHV